MTTSTVTVNDLQTSYVDATRKLIPFTYAVRNKAKPKLDEIQRLFSNALWEARQTGSGHVKLQHKVTAIIIEYQAHAGGRDDDTIHENIKAQLLTQVQLHLNILCNYIFDYTSENWQVAPDYPASLARYNTWALTKPRPLV